MAAWLFKSEPESWSWADQQARGDRGEAWTGVRNAEARNLMQQMEPGALGFFYHTGRERAIVGVVEVIAPAHPDPTDPTGRWACVTLRARASLPRPVTLAQIRTDPALSQMVLLHRPRLSVQPVSPAEWAHLCALGGLGDPS